VPAFFHNDWITRKGEILYRGATPPDADKFYFCLTDSSLLNRSSSLADFISAELPVELGYQRKKIKWEDPGVFSNSNKRYELPRQEAEFVADGGSLQSQIAFLLADAHARAAETIGSSNVTAGGANLFTVSGGHLLSTGDKFMLTPDAGSTLPDPLEEGTVYTAIGASSTNFQPSIDGLTAVTLSNVGSGTFRVKYASGSVVLLFIDEDPIITPDTKPLIYDLDIVEMNTLYAAGV
jgi:hypothetical protein